MGEVERMSRRNARLARRMAKEQDALAKVGARASREVMAAIQRAAAWRFDHDGTFRGADIVEPRMRTLANLVTDSLVASFLSGYWRARLTAHQRRGVPMPRPAVALSAYTESIKHFQVRTGYTDAQLEALEANYRGVATAMIDGASPAVSRALDKVLLDVRKLNLNRRDALKRFRAAVKKNGPTQVRSSVVETMFRTQTAMAYSVGRQRANADPDIDEILWGYEYSTVGDDRVRPAHAAMDGVRAPKDSPLWNDWQPPNGWNCRCTVVEVFDGESLASPNLPPETTTDPESGKTIPVVPDRGWAINPAKVGPPPPSPMAEARPEPRQIGNAVTVADAERQLAAVGVEFAHTPNQIIIQRERLYLDTYGEFRSPADRHRILSNWRDEIGDALPSDQTVIEASNGIAKAISGGRAKPLPVEVLRSAKADDAGGGIYDSGLRSVRIYDTTPKQKRQERTVVALTSKRKMYAADAYADHAEGMYVHEYGHHIGEVEDTVFNARKVLNEIAGDVDAETSLVEAVSMYSGLNPGELFAEAYTISKHPEFNRLPVTAQSLVRRILGASSD